MIIPVFNSAATLPRAIASALAQGNICMEVIVVIDGSPDASQRIAERMAKANRRIKVLCLPENRGKPAAMNLGISRALGEWVAVLDADDAYLPNRLKTLIEHAQRAGVQMVADNQFFIDPGDSRAVRTAFCQAGPDRRLGKDDFAAGSNPLAAFDLGLLKPVINTGFIRSTGLAYREDAVFSEDFLYLADFFAHGGSGMLVAEPYYLWTQPFGSRSRTWTSTGKGPWRYDYGAAIAAYDRALQSMVAAGEIKLARVLRRRIAAFGALDKASRISRTQSERGACAALRMALLYPSTWPLLARRLLGRFRTDVPALEHTT